MCLGIDSSRYAGLYNCIYKNDQAWTRGHAYGVSSYRQLINAKGRCPGVTGASRNPGACVVGWTCLPTHRDQYWVEAGECLVGLDVFYLFQNDESQLVLGVAANRLLPTLTWGFCCGAGGIRTPGTLARPAAFKAAAINRTLPPLPAGSPPAG